MSSPTLVSVPAPPEETVVSIILSTLTSDPDMLLAGVTVVGLEGDPLKLPEVSPTPESSTLPLVRIYPSRLATSQKYEGAYNTTLTLTIEGFTADTHYADPLRLWSLIRSALVAYRDQINAIAGVRCEGFPTMTTAIVRMGENNYGQKISGQWLIYFDTDVPPTA